MKGSTTYCYTLSASTQTALTLRTQLQGGDQPPCFSHGKTRDCSNSSSSLPLPPPSARGLPWRPLCSLEDDDLFHPQFLAASHQVAISPGERLLPEAWCSGQGTGLGDGTPGF